jgi:uncharacterized protein YegL
MKLLLNDPLWFAGRAAIPARSNMKISPAVIFLITVACLGPNPPRVVAAEEDGVALAVVYDTSGSMRDAVRDKDGHSTPKYVIANRALMNIAKQIQTFTTNHSAEAPVKVHAGLYTFDNGKIREAIRFGPFDPDAFENWARDFSMPGGGTPLGNALKKAAHAVLESPLSRKHILIITDGINTVGPQPASVLPQLNHEAEGKQTGFSVHFIAFDVDAREFDGVRKQGATVVGAADEAQLETQLNFILQNQILLEKAEPKK